MDYAEREDYKRRSTFQRVEKWAIVCQRGDKVGDYENGPTCLGRCRHRHGNRCAEIAVSMYTTVLSLALMLTLTLMFVFVFVFVFVSLNKPKMKCVLYFQVLCLFISIASFTLIALSLQRRNKCIVKWRDLREKLLSGHINLTVFFLFLFFFFFPPHAVNFTSRIFNMTPVHQDSSI